MVLKEKEVDRFIKETEKLLLCPKTMKQKFLIDLKNDVVEYVECNNISKMELVYSHFGEPDNIAKSFLDTIDSASIKKATQWKKVLFIGIIVILLFISIYLLFSYIDGQSESAGFIVTEVGEIASEIGGSIT